MCLLVVKLRAHWHSAVKNIALSKFNSNQEPTAKEDNYVVEPRNNQSIGNLE